MVVQKIINDYNYILFFTERVIKKGEEIYFDYGKGYNLAWTKHFNNNLEKIKKAKKLEL